ncbi:MAG: hypothetical protein IPO78_10120 [Saprospiraceae bacterium]|nr:hypothetical protein [Saprospiraceae bacterium]
MNINSHISIGEAINNSLRTSFIVKQGLNKNLNEYVLHKLDYPLLCFFNRLQLTYLSNSKFVIQLFKNTKNYSSFIFEWEIAVLVNKLVAEFGIDENGNDFFEPSKEIAKLHEGSWAGRTWIINSQKFEMYLLDYHDLILAVSN